MDEEMNMDPEQRPWTYDCSGNKVVRMENGEPDYTALWNPQNEENKYAQDKSKTSQC